MPFDEDLASQSNLVFFCNGIFKIFFPIGPEIITFLEIPLQESETPSLLLTAQLPMQMN